MLHKFINICGQLLYFSTEYYVVLRVIMFIRPIGNKWWLNKNKCLPQEDKTSLNTIKWSLRELDKTLLKTNKQLIKMN